MKKLKYLQRLDEYDVNMSGGTETVPTKTPTPTQTPSKRPSPGNPPKPAEEIDPKAYYSGGTETVPTKTPTPTQTPSKRPSPGNPPKPAEEIDPKAWMEMLKKCVERYNSLKKNRLNVSIKESLEKLPGYSKMKSSLPETNPRKHMQLTMEAYSLMYEIAEIEKENFTDEELKQIATDIVRKIFEGSALVKKGMKFEDFNFDLEFTRDSESEEGMKKNLPLSPKGEEETDENIIVEIDKRKIINALTQGFSIQSQSRMFDEDLDEIMSQFDTELFNKYFEFMTKALEGHKYMDLEQFKQIMFYFQQQRENQPEDEPKINPPGMIIPSVMNVQYENDMVVIKVKAICLILMVHEMVKGIFEVISHFGFSGMDLQTLRKVKSKTESLYNEQEGFVYGPIMVSIFKDFYNEVENHLIKRDIITEHDETIMYSLLRDMYDPAITPSRKFIQIFEGIFNIELDKEQWPIEEVAEIYKRIIETEIDREESSPNDAFRKDLYGEEDGYSDYATGEEGESEEDEISQIIKRSKESETSENKPTLDELLDKISDYGIESLTDEERELLKKYSENMSQIIDFKKFELMLEVRKYL
jgi:hypothetical protein